MIEIGSAVIYKPRDLSPPTVKSMVAACEQTGESHCGEVGTPGNSKTRFSRHVDTDVYLFMLLTLPEANRDYWVVSRWIRPDGGLHARGSKLLRAPSPGLQFDLLWK